MTKALFLLASALFATAALAHEPEEPYHEWFKSIQHPTKGSCCDMADGRVTDVRVGPEGYEAWIDGRFPGGEGVGWMAVKQDAVIEGVPNPLHAFVVFFYAGEVRCLVEPEMS